MTLPGGPVEKRVSKRIQAEIDKGRKKFGYNRQKPQRLTQAKTIEISESGRSLSPIRRQDNIGKMGRGEIITLEETVNNLIEEVSEDQ